MNSYEEEIGRLLSELQPIDLSEMKSIKLMNRIDTKYLATTPDVAAMLALAKEDYRVQIVDGAPTGTYDTMYYDTEGLDMYVLHHNRRLKRQKIRTRVYVNSGIAFLEIKNKNNKGRTKKVRVSINLEDFMSFEANPAAKDFFFNESSYPLNGLTPHVRTRFDRITLVNKRKTERLTIDMNLRFENMRTGEKRALPGLVIIELKQDGLCYSEMKEILRSLRIMNKKVSKYCVGTVLTNPNVKSNRFKEKIQYINRLTNDIKHNNESI
jgi:hypothetical protein